MKRVGLLEPIVVDRHEKRYRLIAGERRIRAARMLQWKSIAASLRERLTDAELRDIELEENDNRKSLTEAERAKRYRTSKRLVENARKAKEVLAQSAQKPNQKGTIGFPVALQPGADVSDLGASFQGDNITLICAFRERLDFLERLLECFRLPVAAVLRQLYVDHVDERDRDIGPRRL